MHIILQRLLPYTDSWLLLWAGQPCMHISIYIPNPLVLQSRNVFIIAVAISPDSHQEIYKPYTRGLRNTNTEAETEESSLTQQLTCLRSAHLPQCRHGVGLVEGDNALRVASICESFQQRRRTYWSHWGYTKRHNEHPIPLHALTFSY